MSSSAGQDIGRVQWVNPRRSASKDVKLQPPRQSRKSIANPNYSTSRGGPNYKDQIRSSQAINEEKINIDEAVCKTICVIVEEYLKELRERRKSINNARLSIRDIPSNYNNLMSATVPTTASVDCQSNYIALNDIARLRVRDEQTKAVEIIKQLTVYLRELNSLKCQTDQSTENLVDENVSNKLSDVRNNIIQALNDFILANGDIDVPLVDPDDPSACGRDFDLLMDAQLPDRSQIMDKKVANQHVCNTQTGNTVADLATRRRKPLKTSFDENSASESTEIISSQVVGQELEESLKVHELDIRKREIQKLERDTIELRRLFADFYDLVKIQNESVDTIEQNILVAAAHVNQANQHLSGAASMKGITLLIPITGCITGALIGGPIGMFVGSKLGGITIVCASSLIGLLSSIGARKCMLPKIS